MSQQISGADYTGNDRNDCESRNGRIAKLESGDPVVRKKRGPPDTRGHLAL